MLLLESTPRMNALLLTAPSTFSLTEMDIPDPADDGVLIRVKACGICGSDIHGMDGTSGRRIAPIVMGHEAAGEIVRVGKNVTAWKTGDRVTFDSTEYCGACPACEEGNVNLCSDRKVLGVSCNDYRRHGCFAEYIALPQRILHAIPDDMSYEHAAFAEPVAIALHAADLAPKGRCALVVGAGLIGLLIIQSLRTRGWEKIIAVDKDASRLALAEKLGATSTVLASDPDAATQLLAHTDHHGADAAWEVVGAAQPFDTAIQNTRKNGTVVLVGNLQSSVPFPLQSVVTRQITLRGSCACAGEYPEAVRRIHDGSIQVAPLLTAAVPLADGAAWFARLASGREPLLKVILQP